MFGWDDAIALGIIGGEFVYHRWIDPPTPPKPPAPAASLSIPKTDAGTAYPIFYGRTRIRSPILMWASKPKAVATPNAGFPSAAAPWIYGVDMMMVLGIPFDGGSTGVRHMWAGELLLGEGAPGFVGQNGAGGSGTLGWNIVGSSSGLDGAVGPIYGVAEVLDGRSTQVLCDGSGTPVTWAGQRMVADGVAPNTIPGYRNLVSVFLCAPSFSSPGGLRWAVGSSPNINGYSFEAQTLPATYIGPNQQVGIIDGDIVHTDGDCNPMDVLYDILFGTKGKLGLNTARYDATSWTAAANQLDKEGCGFSIVWDRATPAREMINTIMKHIDGVLYEDAATGLIKVKLVRNDYTVSSLQNINPSNCVAIQGFAASGWTGITNKVRVNYPNRNDEYRPDSAPAQNQANAVGQDGEVFEVVLDFPACNEKPQAIQFAARELSARSRPLMKCSAIVDRTFVGVNPGDVVTLTWPEYNVSGVVMRVAGVNRGTMENPTIKLDLIQDYYAVWRGAVTPIGVTRPPGSGGIAGAGL